MKKLLLIFCCMPLFISSQNYIELDTDILPLVFAAADFADYDNDGDQDLAVIGVTGDFTDKTKIYRNDNGVFTDILANLPIMHMGAVNWVDYDLDGDFDLFLSGQDYATNKYADIYQNTDGVFTNALISLPEGFWNSAGWGDYDNDGDLDLAYSWYNESVAYSAIFRNDNGNYVDIQAFMQGLTAGSMEWGDFDMDGDLDLLHTGTTTDFSKTPVKLYVNDNGEFSEGSFDFLDCAWYNNVLWSDIDNDGDIDIVYVADENGQYPFVYYENTNGSFEIHYTDLYGVRTSNGNIGLVQGDIDNDGDMDFVMTGDNPGYSKSTKIFINTDGEFSELSHGIPGYGSGTVDMTDLDNDGDLDIFMTGYNQSSTVHIGVFINDANSNTYAVNEAPQPPSDLLSEIDGNNVSFSWLAATDDHTPQESLNYNLYVGSSPGMADVICGQSIMDPNSDDYGFHFFPKPGNCQKSLQHMVNGLDDGIYYWSVQAIDQSGMPSDFSEEQSFTVGDVTNLIELDETIDFYPNPASNYVQCYLGNDIYSIEIYNVNGQRVLIKQNAQSDYILNISSLEPGIYMMKCMSSNKTLVEEIMILR